MMDEKQLLKLIESLKARGADFDVALVGGMAVVGHGVRRGTLDFDLLVDTKDFLEFQMVVMRMLEENDERIPTLEELGPMRAEVSNPAAPGSPDSLKNGTLSIVDWNGRRLLDFLSVYYSYEKTGVEQSETIPGLEPLKLMDMPYLVLMKMQAGGPKDRSDVVELYKIASDEQRVEILDVAEKYRMIEQLERLLRAEGFRTKGRNDDE